MVSTKLNEEKSCIIVKKVSLPDTLCNIPHGKTVHFTRAELANNENSLYSAIYRLNKNGEMFSYEVNPNDGSFTITRK